MIWCIQPMMDQKFCFASSLGFLLTMVSIVTVEGTKTRDSSEKSVGMLGDRTCPHNGVNFRGRCFWFTDTRASWFEAGRLCNHLYGDHVTLVTVKDRETNEFIRSFTTRSLWIGLHEMQGHTKWSWVDNTELSVGNFSNWEPGEGPNEPYDPNEPCDSCAILLRKSEFWKDTTCTNSLRYVCAELPSPALCPNGGVFFRDRCYWRGHGVLSWMDADQSCQDEFGPETRLAVARDPETNLFLSRLAETSTWLGLTYRREEGLWRWIDGAPLEYSNWDTWGLFPEPNNIYQWFGDENCAVINKWNYWFDTQCGDTRRRETYFYICAVPPCYQSTEHTSGDLSFEGSGSGNGSVDHIICPENDCKQHCVNGSTCNATGQCICIRQFSGMTCDLDDWKMEVDNEMVNISSGANLTLKCMVNLPIDHILSFTWNKQESGVLPQDRTNITNVLSQGYSILQISGVQMKDAGQYNCTVVLKFSPTSVGLPVTRIAVVDITETSTRPPTFTARSSSERTTHKETSTYAPTTKPNTKMTTGLTKYGQTEKDEKVEKTNIKLENEEESENVSKEVTNQTTFGFVPLFGIMFLTLTVILVAVAAFLIKLKAKERGRLGEGMILMLPQKN